METRRNGTLLVLILLALVLLGFGLDQMGYLGSVRRLFLQVAQPAQGMVSNVASQAGEVLTEQQSRERLIEDNAFLRQELNRLTIENVALRELLAENNRLRALLNYTKNNPGVDFTTASVVGRVVGADPSSLLYTILLDVGARDGVAPGMSVVTERGLVGRVTDVTETGARVLLMIDPASAVNVVTQGSRVEGIVKGDINGTLTMERIPQGVTLDVGDLVLTSGLGGGFPPRLVVGQIVEVFQRDLDLFQSAAIRPTVNFGDLQTVLVITAFEPTVFDQETSNEAE